MLSSLSAELQRYAVAGGSGAALQLEPLKAALGILTEHINMGGDTVIRDGDDVSPRMLFSLQLDGTLLLTIYCLSVLRS